jgi:Ca2+-binding RTX toxin-like protein
VIPDNVVGAGVWGADLPLIPQQCIDHGFVPVNWFVINDEGSFWSDGVAPLVPLGPGIPGSTQNGAFHGTDDADFIVNFGGKRTLHALGGNDCVVAGPDGDIVHGGDGDDVLIGGKKQHKGEFLYDAVALDSLESGGDEATVLAGAGEVSYLDGESGADLCAPGIGDVVVNCEAIGGEAGPASADPDPAGPTDGVGSEEPDILEDGAVQPEGGSGGSEEPLELDVMEAHDPDDQEPT